MWNSFTKDRPNTWTPLAFPVAGEKLLDTAEERLELVTEAPEFAHVPAELIPLANTVQSANAITT
jgi:hypothetical protein